MCFTICNQSVQYFFIFYKSSEQKSPMYLILLKYLNNSHNILIICVIYMSCKASWYTLLLSASFLLLLAASLRPLHYQHSPLGLRSNPLLTSWHTEDVFRGVEISSSLNDILSSIPMEWCIQSSDTEQKPATMLANSDVFKLRYIIN